MVEIQNLTKYYGNKAALKGISFTIKILHRCFVQVDLYFYGITYLFRSFLYFRRFSVCFSQPYHTNMAYCFLRYAQAFLPVAEALLSIFSIFHDMVTFCI